MLLLQSFIAAMLLMTRLPIGRSSKVKCLMEPWPSQAAAQGPLWHPLIGAGIGACQAMICLVCVDLFGLPQSIAVGAALFSHILLTGALHEDGLADCADGLFGANTPDQRLQIMKDSRLGSYGAIALLFSQSTIWLGFSSLPLHQCLALFMALGVISRSLNGIALRWGRPAHCHGLAASQGRPHMATALLSMGIGVCLALVFIPTYNGAIIAACGMLCWCLAYVWGVRRVGGHSGDIFGGAQQVSVVGAVLIAVALNT